VIFILSTVIMILLTEVINNDSTWLIYLPVINSIIACLSPILTFLIGKKLGLFNSQLTESRDVTNKNSDLETQVTDLKMENSILKAVYASEEKITTQIQASEDKVIGQTKTMIQASEEKIIGQTKAMIQASEEKIIRQTKIMTEASEKRLALRIDNMYQLLIAEIRSSKKSKV
jgi:hypothetical protein